MTDPKISSVQAPVAAPATSRALLASKFDYSALSKLIKETFFTGSRASAETCACYIIQTRMGIEDAIKFPETLKPLPTVIPPHNVTPLARVCSFLALSFDDELCGAPLEAFTYADTLSKRCAINAVISGLVSPLSRKTVSFEVLISRSRRFFDRLMADPDEVCRYEVVRALLTIPHVTPLADLNHLVSFLLSL